MRNRAGLRAEFCGDRGLGSVVARRRTPPERFQPWDTAESSSGVLESSLGVLESLIGASQSFSGALESSIGALESSNGAPDSSHGALDSSHGVLESSIGAWESSLGALHNSLSSWSLCLKRPRRRELTFETAQRLSDFAPRLRLQK